MISNIVDGMVLSFKAKPTYIKAIATKIVAAISLVEKNLFKTTDKNIIAIATASPKIVSTILIV